MKETESFIAKAKRFLKSAEILIKEEDYDSSVSRAYYAMFYSVEAVLLTKSIATSSHKGIISKFGEIFIKMAYFRKKWGGNSIEHLKKDN